MAHKEIVIDTPEEKKALAELNKRTDAEAARMRRFMAMPDLSRTPSSPLYEIVQQALGAKSLEGFDIIKIPEIVPAHITFDLFNMPVGHPARSKSDTYYVTETDILRTHDTVMWHYYLTLPEIQAKIKNDRQGTGHRQQALSLDTPCEKSERLQKFDAHSDRIKPKRLLLQAEDRYGSASRIR
jgi:phenylalanyl-tRNA synthetase alpha subunit